MPAEIDYDKQVPLGWFALFPLDWERRHNAIRRDNHRLTRQIADLEQECERRRWIIAALLADRPGGTAKITVDQQFAAADAPLDCYRDARDDTFNVRIGKPSDPVADPDLGEGQAE